MSRLFVRRDPLYLVEREGMVEASRELPDFLREAPLTAHDFYSRDYHHIWDEDAELILKNGAKAFVKPVRYPFLRSYQPVPKVVPALWSGYRSCLTQDEKTGELFRLKGVALGNVHLIATSNTYVEGGQFLRNAHFERIYSDLFNKTLQEEGIEPVMEYMGMYRFLRDVHFPNHKVKKKRRTLATSIMRVKGDTRLDELFAVLEGLLFRYTHDAVNRMEKKKDLDIKTIINVEDLYLRLGKTVGQLKRLMDKSKQTWSDNPYHSNAHIGNVVVYEDDAGNLAVGLVDFDASCDLRDKTLSELRKQQSIEYGALHQSAHDENISYRRMGQILSGRFRNEIGIFLFGPEHYFGKLIHDFRQAFKNGFEAGYASRPQTITNVIPGWRFKELFSRILEPEQPKPKLEDIVKQPENKLSYLQTTPSGRV